MILWTKEQIQTIVDHHQSSSYRSLGEMVNKSRNSIAGMIWRLREEKKIPPKVVIIPTNPPRVRKKKEKIPMPKYVTLPIVRPEEVEVEIEVDPNRITITNVTGCRFPLHKHERGINMELCNKPTSGSWCAEHKAVVFQPRTERKFRPLRHV